MVQRLRLDDETATEVAVRRSKQARRLTLTVPQNGDPPRVTAPPSVPLGEIRMFLLRQGDWLRRAIERAPAPVSVIPGTQIPVAGQMLTIVHLPGTRRPPVIDGEALLLSGGAPDATGRRILAWLKERARAEVTTVARTCAVTLGANVGRVSMRDTKGQWGACTSKGDLSFSWRLAMAPPSVLDYVAAHEAAHLVEMNHSPRFWALVDQLRPDWRAERAWLRAEGTALHRFRFT